MSLHKIPRVSFVIPCHNYGCYLGDCLHSILSQEGVEDFEILLINDASTDNTEDIIRSYTDSRIRVFRHPKNLGHIATVNEGLKEAHGEFIARIDADDRYRPNFLATTLEKFRVFPEVGLVYGDVALINEEGEITAEHCDRIHNGKDYKGLEFIQLLEDHFVCSPAVIARREAWQKVLPIPTYAIVDDWYGELIMAREYEFYYINQVLAEYRVHSLNHHSRTILDKSNERAVFWLLDRVFSEPEKAFELEARKQRLKRKIYGAHYLTLADKYFGFEMDIDSRRCYLRALQYQPRYFLKATLLRRLMATLIGRKTYEGFKTFCLNLLSK